MLHFYSKIGARVGDKVGASVGHRVSLSPVGANVVDTVGDIVGLGTMTRLSQSNSAGG